MWVLLAIFVGGISLLLIAAGVVVGWWFLSGRHSAASRQLQQRFYSLNPLKGKTREEIEKVVGPPTSQWAGEGNRTVCSWDRSGYMIMLAFTGNVCEGVSNEVRS